MESPNRQPDLGLFASIDFQAFVETLRLRWWVFPAVIGAFFAFFQVQNMASRNQPSLISVTRIYEINSPQKTLEALGIQLRAVEFPNPSSQLEVLASENTRQEVVAELGFEADVILPDEWNKLLDRLEFKCTAPTETNCNVTIEAYVSKLVAIRREAVKRGLKNLSQVLEGAQSTNSEAAMSSQLVVLKELISEPAVESSLISSTASVEETTANQLSRRTMFSGIGAALLVACLIILQLAYSDNRVRSVRQLVRLVGEDTYVGTASTIADPVNARRSAIALHRGLSASNSTTVRFIPLRHASPDNSSLSSIAEMAGVEHSVSAPFAELSVIELVSERSGHADVIIVKRNQDLRRDVIEAYAALGRSRRPLAGVILIN